MNISVSGIVKQLHFDYIGRMQGQLKQDPYYENSKWKYTAEKKVLKDSLESININWRNEEFLKQVKLNPHQTYINFPEKNVIYNKLSISKKLQ